MELTYIKNNNQIDMFSIIENWKQNKDKINEELYTTPKVKTI